MLGPRGVTRARQLRPLRLWPRRPWGDGSIMASMQKRLQKELLALQNDPPPGMTLNEKSVQNSITQWIVDMEGAPGTLYEGEKFQLLFKFSSRYPFDSPQVMFTGENIPVHPHVYSNGHICLSILTEDWSPALSVQSVCLSIISMLSSCKEKILSDGERGKRPERKIIDDHQIILFMFEHVTRIQRKQNGGIMMILVDATVLILLAEDSPTEKMSTLIIQSLNFNL
ncbi:ubiquitin-conjugating enzyme E2 W isoform X1 [Ovis aries]|uniref:Ubiquitin conjugating enzyme E2 W n=2 Tax=Caprinae TaxID=9963 RepID=A0AC11ELG0_SHEEP|nr:ubiquitin-conjugating enzyme E2 W isoform X1 [Ovis aries]